jgi:hypothetical protein
VHAMGEGQGRTGSSCRSSKVIMFMHVGVASVCWEF